MSVRLIRDKVQYLGIGTPPDDPVAGQFFLYFKADGILYRKNSAGAEIQIGAGGGGVNVTITLNNGEAGAMVAGDVVVIDTGVDSSCLFSTTNKDTKVAGVISVGGASGQPVQVCTSGIIDAKVTGVVSRGDSLSTSTTSTRANSAGGAVNAVVGKALEASGGGLATIKVLVNLA